MRKFVALILIVLIHINIVFSTVSASDNNFVSNAVAAAEGKLSIPDIYSDFNSRVVIEKDGQYAYLTWKSEDSNGGQINVTVDEKYRITSFNQYFYGDFTGNYKLSEITSIQAKDIAADFCKTVCPEFFEYVKTGDVVKTVNRNYVPYNFRFYRYENKIPCYDNYIDITVNPYNCQVSSMNVVWDDFDKIYDSSTALTVNEAKNAMYNNIGMILEYAKDKNGNRYKRYADMSDYTTYINAYTGELVDTNVIRNYGRNNNAAYTEKYFNPMPSGSEFDLKLCEDVVKNNKYISYDKSYKLISTSYLEDEVGNYALLAYMTENGNVKSYMIDTDSGDIRYFEQQTGITNQNHGLSVADCRKIARLFCRKYEKNFLDKCRLLNISNIKNVYGEDICYFNYARKINDVVYNDNGMVIGVSRATGQVVSVRTGWDNIESVEFDKIIPVDNAFGIYIDSVDFGLQYVKEETLAKQTEMRLVYAPNPNIEIYVDAVEGRLVDSDGNNYYSDFSGYSDISGDISEEQIKILLSCDILDMEESFRPDENILLKDFLLWMCRAVDCRAYESIDAIYDDTNSVADNLVRRNIVTYDDLKTNGPVNMENGIKYIVSYLGYDDVAMIKDTYKTGFVDEGMITPEYIGYAAIAKGLKIFDGNAFLPKEYMKRNVAVQVLYNLISN